MRNDARPLGERSPASPFGGPEGSMGKGGSRPGGRLDQGDSVAHDGESHKRDRAVEERQPGPAGDPALPSSDSSTNTRI